MCRDCTEYGGEPMVRNLVGIMCRDFHFQKQLKPKHANMHAAGPFTEQV